jgi:general secretion pathway protein G
MKKSFTMIELIFVIVILGILAAVAIPKLAATRDDAETAKLATQARDGMEEFISYYTANGGEINFSQMQSQIVLNELISHGWVKVKDDTHAVFYSNRKDKTVCINYKTDGKKVEVDTNSSNNESLCKDIKQFVKDRNYSVLDNAVNF